MKLTKIILAPALLVSIASIGMNSYGASSNEIDTNSYSVNFISQSMASFSASIAPGPYKIVDGKNVPKN